MFSIAVNVSIDVGALPSLSQGLLLLISALLIGTPAFFAAVCFSALFREESATGYALGLSLVGAMIGGFLEYSSMLLGLRAIWALALVVYLLALLAWHIRGRTSQLHFSAARGEAEHPVDPAHLGK